MRFRCHTHVKKSGVTLLEMMMAITLALLLMMSLIKIYNNLLLNMNVQSALQIQQEKAQQIRSLLQREIAKAGYIGCARLSRDFQVYSPLPFTITPENALIVQSDRLVVRYQGFPGVVLTENMHQPQRLMTSTHERYHPNQILMISDCEHAELFRVGSVALVNGRQWIRPSQPLRYLYMKNAELGELMIHEYYLSHSCDQDCVLMQREMGIEAELVSGIKNLVLRQDSAGVHFAFQTAGKASLNWSGYVVSKRL